MSKEDSKKCLEIGDTLYGINNEIYTIENIDNEQIVIKFYKKIYLTYNSGNNQEVKIKEEDLYFSFDDIGLQLFFKEGDCYKSVNELLEDTDYLNYIKNLNNRIEIENLNEQKKLQYIEALSPNTRKITNKDIDLILSSYYDEEKSLKEEKDFYSYSQNHNMSYFARMDFDTEYENEDYYEKFYISKNTKPIEIEEGVSIIDWRSPLGDFYYNNEKTELLREKYKYKVLLKRKFIFEPFKFLNTYIANDDFFNEGMADEFLMQILLEKRNSGKLTDIIYSIQSNQNKIIRAKPFENFIVQGCAGSGKTMILLHRLSYLKYNNWLPEYKKIKIITPGKIFNDFISDLSRDLNIEEIEQTSILNYYLELNNNYNEKHNLSQSLGERFYKLSSRGGMYEKDIRRDNIIKSIKETINRKKNRYKEYFKVDKMYDENNLDSNMIKSFYNREFFDKVKNKYKRRIDFIKDEISRIFNYSEKISNNQYFEIFIIKSMELINELLIEIQNEKWYNGGLYGKSKEKCEENERKIQEIKQLQDEVLNNFYFSFDFYNEIIEEIQRNNPSIPKNKYMRFQLLLMLYINYLHFGELLNGDKLLCFDEAQDYNEVEYRILKLINNNVVFNLYGDVNQSIFSKSITDWSTLKKFIDFKQYNLNENFRNTKQISDFCNEKFKYNSLSMGIIGENVEYIEKKKINNIILKKINEKKKIAIITQNKDDIENIIPIDSEYTFYGTIEQVKGIEFDSVIVFEDKMTKNEKYIAYTRALNNLYIVN